MISKALYSSRSYEWITPEHIYNELNDEFNFTLDPCSTAENAKCKKFFTIIENGLAHSWKGENVFCNPPYSEVKLWVEKAYNECVKNNVLTVMLIPARVDTKWFHEFIYKKFEVRFIKGRVHYSNSKNGCPSMIVIFKANPDKSESK